MLFSEEMIKCWSYFSFKWDFEHMTKYFVPEGNKYFYYVKTLIVVIISKFGEWQHSKASKSKK